MYDPGFASGKFLDLVSQVDDRDLLGVAYVEDLARRPWIGGNPKDPADGVGCIAEGAGLVSLAIDGNVSAGGCSVYES